MSLSTSPRCSIIIVVFNQLAYTRDCIDSLLRVVEPVPFEIIIVNNGSTDGTVEYLERLRSANEGIKVLNSRVNLGYAYGNNKGVGNATGDLLLFLNNDTIVTDSFLTPLVAVTEREGFGVAGAKLLYPEFKVINHAGYVYSAAVQRFYLVYELFPADHPAVNKERELQAVLGACMLMKRITFEQIGKFHHIGLEDIDLCLRVRAAGLKILYVPASTVYHYGRTTLDNSSPGEIPPTYVEDFNHRWPITTFFSDDLDIYSKDGFRICEWRDGRPVLEQLVVK